MTGRPARPSPASCRSCGADIYWAVTEAGKANPVDAKPAANGNTRLFWRSHKLRSAIVAQADRTVGGEYYMPHHATCPHGKDWRR